MIEYGALAPAVTDRVPAPACKRVAPGDVAEASAVAQILLDQVATGVPAVSPSRLRELVDGFRLHGIIVVSPGDHNIAAYFCCEPVTRLVPLRHGLSMSAQRHEHNTQHTTTRQRPRPLYLFSFSNCSFFHLH